MSGPLFSDDPHGTQDAPLAERMRPRTLDEVVGQEHLVGAAGVLTRAAAARRLPSILFWGPPGTGKTTLARLLARAVGAELFPLSAVSSGVKEVREVVDRARRVRAAGGTAVLFIDEIHRFHRGQQDALLPAIEDGTVTFIGATTENPAHTVVAPLVSRSRVLVLEPLAPDRLEVLLRRAVQDERGGLARDGLDVGEPVIREIAREADGDARRALGTLDLAIAIASARAAGGPVHVVPDDVRQAAQRRLIRADRAGDAHYDLASAFIKAMRGSDPDAAVYYLMRMIEVGVDPRFAARRMTVLAAEDVGLADPRALLVAVGAWDAFERLGLPEGSLPLAEAAIYLATAPKSASVIAARDAALAAVRERGTLPIPDELRDGSAPLSRELGLGSGYTYPHDAPGHHVPVAYLPEDLRGTRIYSPSDQGAERETGRRLARWRGAVDDSLSNRDRGREEP
ncbi:MAG: replication-associated recombination protein A [Acidobacteriota bacterium]|nr:replication-associated recombination protein A [Acidobacteriota bacterium]